LGVRGTFRRSEPATKPLLETDRLQLREFALGDLDALAAMVGDEDQMRFYPRARTRDEAAAWIRRNLALYKDCGFGFWLLASRATSAFLGYCGIRPLVLGGVSEIEIGWHTRKTSWNQGIATEAAMAARDLAFGRFRVPRLVALVHPEHTASRRVAEKIGMHYERTTTVENDPLVVYAVARVRGGSS
jgi:RimJ/RimL family protein N-acetyltransferase